MDNQKKPIPIYRKNSVTLKAHDKKVTEINKSMKAAPRRSALMSSPAFKPEVSMPGFRAFSILIVAAICVLASCSPKCGCKTTYGMSGYQPINCK